MRVRVALVAVGVAVLIGGTALALSDGDDQPGRESAAWVTTTADVPPSTLPVPPGEPSATRVYREGVCFDAAGVDVSCSGVHVREEFGGFRITGTLGAGDRLGNTPPLERKMLEVCSELFMEYTGLTATDPRYSVGAGAAGASPDGLVSDVTCSLSGPRGNLDPLTGSARKPS